MNDDKDLYFKIARDSQPAISRILNEIRTEMIKILGSKRIGIWGPYRDIIQGVRSNKIIDGLAKEFVKEGFTVITGNGIYIRASVKTQLLGSFFKLLTTLAAKIAQKDLYKYLVTYAPNAVFIETSSRSTSIFEEESFYDNDYLTNELGVGFLILENEPLECSKLEIEEIDDFQFWLCNGTIPSHCIKNIGKCTFFDQGVNYATINMFVISEYMKLALTTDYHHIPKIMTSLLNTS